MEKSGKSHKIFIAEIEISGIAQLKQLMILIVQKMVLLNVQYIPCPISHTKCSLDLCMLITVYS